MYLFLILHNLSTLIFYLSHSYIFLFFLMLLGTFCGTLFTFIIQNKKTKRFFPNVSRGNTFFCPSDIRSDKIMKPILWNLSPGKKNGRLVDGLYIIITIYNCRRSDKQLKRHLTARKRMRKCTHANRTRRLQMALEGNPKWKSKKLPVGFALETIPKRPKLEQ